MNASIKPNVADYLTVAADQAHGIYGNLTLLLLNATLGVVVIYPSITNVSIISPAVGDLFARDVFNISQACAYPMIGKRDEFWILYFDVTADSYIAGQYRFFKDLWKAICVMLQGFKYWLVEGSLHEPLKLSKGSDEYGGTKYPAEGLHRSFKKVRLSIPCDKCRNPARSMKHQCTDCDQEDRMNCWPWM